ncbi:hypothetical protein BX659_13815 [Orenia metallireducens]|jgi:hypothetical protein|uniref:1-phosphatidylinositol phosphodiesterase n=1 Tax=Orenia metallireducens TaxID=1413210 RepID=A0A285IDX9_9FIRM|nr:hypothetical protein [Orenia metallireducens]PRX19651.1 hypothetical protein BX659_13815 [Orenia metallireducens]SNY45997.1 hypothetical protein SAMN06265827_14015 [Orenia metallireducens]
MKKSLLKKVAMVTVLLALISTAVMILQGSCYAEYVEQTYNVESWMEDIADEIANRELRDLVIPGTHDSGSRELDGWLLADFTQTQNHTIKSQLEHGIRYFDFRATYTSDGKGWIFSHGGFDMMDRIFPALDNIKTFLDNHPKELVIIDFQHFPEWDDEDDQAHITELKDKMMNTLGAYMVPENWGVHTKVYQLWNSNQRVIILMDHETMYSEFSATEQEYIWNRANAIRSYWANEGDEEALIEELDSEVQTMKSGYQSQTAEYYDKFHVLQAQTTASSQLDSLWDGANDSNPALLPLLLGQDIGLETSDWTTAPLNIIIMDFAIDTTDLVEVCKTKNLDVGNYSGSYEGVYLYQNSSYGGYYIRLTENTPAVSDQYIVDEDGYDDHISMNDQISSILIVGDYQVQIFEDDNYGGTSQWISTSTPYLADDWNDRISSVKVYKNE